VDVPSSYISYIYVITPKGTMMGMAIGMLILAAMLITVMMMDHCTTLTTTTTATTTTVAMEAALHGHEGCSSSNETGGLIARVPAQLDTDITRHGTVPHIFDQLGFA
jgi:hypothetical protein